MANQYKISVFDTVNKVWLKNFIISDSGKVYTCSEIGDDINFDNFYSTHEYFDNVSFADITNQVELKIEALNEPVNL